MMQRQQVGTREVRQKLAERRAERQPRPLEKAQHRQSRQDFGDRPDTKSVLGTVRHAEFGVGQAVGAAEHDPAAPGDEHRAAERALRGVGANERV